MDETDAVACDHVAFDLLVDGEYRKEVEVKALIHPDGATMWHFRRVTAIFLNRAKPEKVGVLIRRDLQPWVGMAQELFGPGFYTASEASTIFHNRAHDDHEDQEWCLTTHGMLSLLMWCSVHRRMLDERKLCEGAYVGFLRRTLGLDAVLDAVYADCMEEACQHCDADVSDVPPHACRCFRKALSVLGPRTDDTSWPSVALFVAHLVKGSAGANGCKATLFYFGAIVCGLATRVDAFMKGAKLQTDPLRCRHTPTGPRKLRRIDRDVKERAAAAVASGAASSVPALFKSLADRRGQNAHNWVADRLQLEVAKTRLTWGGGGTLVVVTDDSRFDHPSENTALYCVWHPASYTGAWGLIQVT